MLLGKRTCVLLQGVLAMCVPFLFELRCRPLFGDLEQTHLSVVPLLCLGVSRDVLSNGCTRVFSRCITDINPKLRCVTFDQN
jgi:hypothetical protein